MEYDKSFAIFSATSLGTTSLNETDNLIHESGRLQLNTYQAFVSNMMNPRSDLRSLMLMHKTGTGKTISALATATEYVRQHQPQVNEQSVSSIVVLGFTKDIFKKELLKHPEFLFVSFDEATELKELEQKMHDSETIAEEYQNKRKRYQRRLFRKEVKGIYQFYGYRQFANRIINMDDLQGMIKKENGKDMNEDSIDAKLTLKWIKDGKVRINTNFIRSLAHSFFICDEVHNLYKNDNLNTYGIAVKLVFDYYYKTLTAGDIDHASVRSLLLSATPLTSSALEVIPIISLLTGDDVQYQDLFKTVSGIDELTPAGSAKIRNLVSGRISYIMDDNPREYPSSSFVGDKISGVEYLRFIRTKPVGHQLKCLEHWTDRAQLIDERGSNMVKDIAMPATKEYPYGVIFSKSISDLADLPAQVAVRKGASGYLTSNIFKLANLKSYSSKYAKLVEMCLAMKGKDHGKLFLFHPFVQGSGTDLIISILVANGFILHGDNPTNDSVCMNCNLKYGSHKGDHEFVPLVLTFINGNLSKPAVASRLATYNAENNKFGERVKIVVGSKAMRESHTLIACRHVVILHEPSSISEMIQIIGRAVRKYVHAILPSGMRSVSIHVITTNVSSVKNISNDTAANEEWSYRMKVLQYKQIDRIDRIMYDVSIDYLINFRFKLNETPPLLGEAFPLDQDRFAKYEKVLTKTYADLRNGTAARGIHTNRFNVFYFEGEVKTTAIIIKRLLLDFQPVITIRQLKQEIRNPPFHVEYNTQLISDEAIAVAVNNLVFEAYDLRVIRPPSDLSLVDSLYNQTPTIIDAAGVHYKILCIGHPLCLDSILLKRSLVAIVENDNSIIDSYRQIHVKPTNVIVDLQQLSNNWSDVIDTADMISELKDVELTRFDSITNGYSNQTHQRLAEWAIENAIKHAMFRENVPQLDLVKKVIQYYASKRLIITVSQLATTRAAEKYKSIKIGTGSPWYSTLSKPSLSNLPIGHMIVSLVRLYDMKDRTWMEIASIGNGVQNKHPYGFYIYEERIKNSLNVVVKIRFETDKKTGITMVFLQKPEIEKVAKALKANIKDMPAKSQMIDSIEKAAGLIQTSIFPKRLIYRLVDL